jgi:hypothetical protein
MLNLDIVKAPIGPNGEYGAADLAIVDGKLQVSVQLSPKAVLDAAAKKIGGPIPAEVAQFLEQAIGLS